MKQSLGYFLLALAMAALGAASLALGRLEQRLAGAEERLATLDPAGVEKVLGRAERFYLATRHIPFVGDAPLNAVRTERASLHYWQQDYAAIVPAGADPIGALAPDNVDLQFIVANAVFRQAHAFTEPAARAQALSSAMAAQLAVLKNSVRNEDAAFNYEYIARLRALVPRKGAAAAATVVEGIPERTLHGDPGDPPPEGVQQDFKVHVPLEQKEMGDDADEGDDAGKDGPPPRRG